MASKNKETKERDKTVNLPVPMVNKIDEIIAKEELGFLKRADFVRNAVRESIIKYNRILNDENERRDSNDK